jgi:3-phosphoshikimate 1-carboxyvinyltransferase
MAAAVAALAASGESEVLGWECVEVSYPGFERDLARVVVR